MAGQDGLSFGGAEKGKEPPGRVGGRGVTQDSGGVAGGYLDLGRNVDDLQAASGRKHIGAIDETGVGFTEFQLRRDLADVGLKRNDAPQNGVGKSRVASIGRMESKHLAGVGAGRDGFRSHDDTAAGLREILEAVYVGWVAGGDGKDQLVGGDNRLRRSEEAAAVQGVQVIVVCGDEQIGLSAGLDLETEDLRPREVADDPDVRIGALEGVGGIAHGLTQGRGGKNVKFPGWRGIAGAEENNEQERRQEGMDEIVRAGCRRRGVRTRGRVDVRR